MASLLFGNILSVQQDSQKESDSLGRQITGFELEADETDNFKPVFKRYKRKDRALDLSAVVDVDKKVHVNVAPFKALNPDLKPIQGMKTVQEWDIFRFIDNEGFYLIRNPFLTDYQRYWISRCLKDLPLPPHKTNLPVHPDVDPRSLWAHFESSHQKGEPFENSSPLRKLRWTTLGYHYDWNTKEYREADFTPFPDDLGALAEFVTQALGLGPFQAQAGIVNYYYLDSSLAAHTDHSELDHQAPLLSISFGQDAIFLLGGKTKATVPSAILLRSGDICVMSGPSRLAFHAVPRILPPHPPAPPLCSDPTNHQLPGAMTGSGFHSELNGEDVQTGCQGESSGVVLEDSERKGDWNQSGCPENKSYEDKDICSQVTGKKEKAQNTVCYCDHSVSCAQSVDGSLDQSNVDHSDQSNVGNCNQTQFSSQAIASCVNKLSENHTCKHERHSSQETESRSSFPQNSEASTVQEDAFSTKKDSVQDRILNVNRNIVATLQTLNWEPFARYLSTSRININIRQVLKSGQTFRSCLSPELDIKRPRKDVSE